MSSPSVPELRWHAGGCHCGAVRFEVLTPDAVEVEDCDCSICAKTGFLHLIVPADRFRITLGAAGLTRYRFNTGVAEHLFCPTCGVKPFYVPRSNPKGWSVNLRCLDPGNGLQVTVTPFDGQRWEESAPRIAHKA